MHNSMRDTVTPSLDASDASGNLSDRTDFTTPPARSSSKRPAEDPLLRNGKAAKFSQYDEQVKQTEDDEYSHWYIKPVEGGPQAFETKKESQAALQEWVEELENDQRRTDQLHKHGYIRDKGCPIHNGRVINSGSNTCYKLLELIDDYQYESEPDSEWERDDPVYAKRPNRFRAFQRQYNQITRKLGTGSKDYADQLLDDDDDDDDDDDANAGAKSPNQKTAHSLRKRHDYELEQSKGNSSKVKSDNNKKNSIDEADNDGPDYAYVGPIGGGMSPKPKHRAQLAAEKQYQKEIDKDFELMFGPAQEAGAKSFSHEAHINSNSQDEDSDYVD